MNETTKANDGGSAFPQPAINYEGRIDYAEDMDRGGMTLRAYFAAKAMQGLLAATRDGQRWFYDGKWNNDVNPMLLAKLSVEAADALIAKLNK